MTVHTTAGNSADIAIPKFMNCWVLGDPGQLSFTEKPVPTPGPAEVLVRIDAIAVCATDLEIIYHGPPALIQGASAHARRLMLGGFGVLMLASAILGLANSF
jgi:L-iditol 2-dehydrogenase